MATEKEVKLLAIKRADSAKYEAVVKGEMNITDAYNEVKRVQLGLNEFRGKSTKKKHFTSDFKRIIELHDPSPDELKAEIKKAYPFTWKEFLIP
jgi:hypothetical protein